MSEYLVPETFHATASSFTKDSAVQMSFVESSALPENRVIPSGAGSNSSGVYSLFSLWRSKWQNSFLS